MNNKERTKEFRIEIGTRFKDKNRDITIIDRKKIKDKNGREYKYYKYKCNKCGFDGGKHYSIRSKTYEEELWINESHLLLNEQGCSCCQGNQTIVKGINDISATNPEMIRYFVDIEDAYTHSQSSADKIWMICSDCGYKRKFEINRLYRFGFHCSRCQDKIPYPEKFTFSILEQLKIDFQTQLAKTTFEWCGKYYYDFYFKINDEEYIIETHGLQHYEITNRKNAKTLKEEQENDERKKQIALDNGINGDNYIILDCRYSKLEFIKQNILNSRLNGLFDLSKIDWLKAEEFALSSRIKEACEYKKNNPDMTTTEIGEIMKVSPDTIRNYLKKGNKIGLCNYNSKEEMKKPKKSLRKRVEIFKDNISLGIFESIMDLEQKSEELFGIKLDSGNISKICNGKRKYHKGFTFKYTYK